MFSFSFFGYKVAKLKIVAEFKIVTELKIVAEFKIVTELKIVAESQSLAF